MINQLYNKFNKTCDQYRLEDGTPVPKECAIKIYKMTLNNFFRRDKYIKDDYRFKDRFGKQNPRKLVPMWAEKEMYNLKRYFKNGWPNQLQVT